MSPDGGNQYRSGNVDVYLNELLFGSASGGEFPKSSSTLFIDGDILKICEYNAAVIVFSSVAFNCQAMKAKNDAAATAMKAMQAKMVVTASAMKAMKARNVAAVPAAMKALTAIYIFIYVADVLVSELRK